MAHLGSGAMSDMSPRCAHIGPRLEQGDSLTSAISVGSFIARTAPDNRERTLRVKTDECDRFSEVVRL